MILRAITPKSISGKDSNPLRSPPELLLLLLEPTVVLVDILVHPPPSF